MPRARRVHSWEVSVYSGPGGQFTDKLMDALVREHGDDNRRPHDDLTPLLQLHGERGAMLIGERNTA